MFTVVVHVNAWSAVLKPPKYPTKCLNGDYVTVQCTFDVSIADHASSPGDDGYCYSTCDGVAADDYYYDY